MRDSKKIGFIGLGVMGLPMASNLQKAGVELLVFDIDKERAKLLPLQDKVKVAESPADVAAQVRTVILMLPNSPHVEAVINGENGLLKTMKAGTFVIDMSSISPVVTKKLGEQLTAKGIDFIDAPVSGGQTGAVSGALTIMVGGKKELLEEARPLFSAMGKRIVLCGEVGAGQTVKVVNQLMSAVNLVSMSEGFILGVKAGVDPVIMREVIVSGSGRCWALEDRMPVILDGNFEPGFTIDLHTKDISLAVDMADDLKVPLFATNLAHELFKTAQLKGKGRKDNAAIINVYEELAGVEVRRTKDEV